METDYHHILLVAAESPFGVCVTTSNPQLARNKLYKVKREFPEFAHLSILSPPVSPETQLWIVKREAEYVPPEN